MAKNNNAKKPKKNDVKFHNTNPTGNPGNYPMNEDVNLPGTGKKK